MNGFERKIAEITGRTSKDDVYQITQMMYVYGLRFSELSATSFKKWAKRCDRELTSCGILN